VNVANGVSVQNVEFLANGQVIGSDSTAPFQFPAIAPLITPDTNSITFQARVTDTGGFATTTNLLTLDLLKDVTPPVILGTEPADSATSVQGLQTLKVNFSESLAKGSVTLANFQLLEAGPGGVFDDGNDVAVAIQSIQLQNDDAQVVLTVAPLSAGKYRLTVVEDGITDRAGNALGTGTMSSTFTLQNATVLNFDQGPDPRFTYTGIGFVGSVRVGSGYDNVRAFTGKNIVAFNPFAVSPSDFRWVGGSSPTFDLASFVIAGAWGQQTLLIQGFQGGVVKFSSPLFVTPAPVVFTPNWHGIDDLRINIGHDYVSYNIGGDGQHWALANLTIGVPLPLQASASGTGDAMRITAAHVEPLIATAVQFWAGALSLQEMPDIRVVVEDLPGGELATTRSADTGAGASAVITVDADANGVGWFTDSTPLENSEFQNYLTASTLEAGADSPAGGKYDLFTVVLHEIGHVLGFAYENPTFASHVTTAADGSLHFAAPNFDATLTPDGNHLDSAVHPWDLLNASLQPGVGELPSDLDVQILALASQTTDSRAALTSALPLHASPAPTATVLGPLDQPVLLDRDGQLSGTPTQESWWQLLDATAGGPSDLPLAPWFQRRPDEQQHANGIVRPDGDWLFAGELTSRTAGGLPRVDGGGDGRTAPMSESATELAPIDAFDEVYSSGWQLGA
jgi:hypothetical protein